MEAGKEIPERPRKFAELPFLSSISHLFNLYAGSPDKALGAIIKTRISQLEKSSRLHSLTNLKLPTFIKANILKALLEFTQAKLLFSEFYGPLKKKFSDIKKKRLDARGQR